MRGAVLAVLFGMLAPCYGSEDAEGFVMGEQEGEIGELISVSGEQVQAHPW